MMPWGIGTINLPFGPVTSSCSPTSIFTPLGRGIGFLPILDISHLRSKQALACRHLEQALGTSSWNKLLEQALPHAAEDLAADVLLVRVPPGHDPARGGQNVDSHPAQHSRDVGLPHVHAADQH